MSPEPEGVWWVKNPSIKSKPVGQRLHYQRKDAFTYDAKISSCKELNCNSNHSYRILPNDLGIN